MTPTERTGDRRVELHVRESLPAPARERRDAIECRLESLESAKGLAEFDVLTWPKRIPVESPAATAARDRYLTFQAWAREAGVRLTPFFGTRECYSMETGDSGEWLVFPALCLAVYEGGDLAAVYPHADESGTRDVADGLDDLARTEADDSGEAAGRDPVTTGRAD